MLNMAATLEATGDYRILRRMKPRRQLLEKDGSKTRLGILIDLETTGLDPAKDEIIEMALVPFEYGLDGRIFEVREPFSALRQPSKPIPPEITQITGITDEMVAGKTIDPTEVAAFVAPAALSTGRRMENNLSSRSSVVSFGGSVLSLGDFSAIRASLGAGTAVSGLATAVSALPADPVMANHPSGYQDDDRQRRRNIPDVDHCSSPS